jgi:hypothetical protein
MNQRVDTPDAYIDAIARSERETPGYILRASCFDQDRILTKGNRWGDGSHAWNRWHPHP